MKSQAYRMTMLYDFYGELLTDRQKEFYDLYYNDDLSLAEIAENYGITRQGVRDIIVRAEKTLEDIEEKTGLIHRYRQTRQAVAALERIAEDIHTLNKNQLDNPELNRLYLRLTQTIDTLGRD